MFYWDCHADRMLEVFPMDLGSAPTLCMDFVLALVINCELYQLLHLNSDDRVCTVVLSFGYASLCSRTWHWYAESEAH